MKHFLNKKIVTLLHNYIARNISVFVILAFVLAISVANYTNGTYLTGWDNLHPEFAFDVNIKRSIFAVWQEYQSAGLLGGMGHAADLLRQVFLWLLSFILPLSLLRYIFTFLMLFLGSVGTFYLVNYIARGDATGGRPIHSPAAHPQTMSITNGRGLGEDVGWDEGAAGPQAIALLGAIFYLLNLATMQTFYAPFEAFSAHFAALPWLILTVLTYYFNPTKKTLVFLIIVLILATPQAYIPTLFVVSLLAIAILLAVVSATNPVQISAKISILRSIRIFALIFLINSFWFLPFLYFTLTNAATNLDAKINQMATETVFLQNKEFGDIFSVMQLRGFWFNNVDPNSNGAFTYMFSPWRQHLANPLISGLGYLFFGVILFGVFGVVRDFWEKRKHFSSFNFHLSTSSAFLVLFLFAFTMLATATPPFSWFDQIFRLIPLFDQAFRFPFTKFSILAALTYSIFFALGIKTIANLLSKRITNYKLQITKIIPVTCYLLLVTCFIIYALPAFSGHLFYEKEKLAIPKEYFDLFAFFKSQDQNTRIANFPQQTYWGWNFYQWGYGGSGFLWYGIKQPIMDRAFDVWGKTSENYYFEISRALYSKNSSAFEKTLNKYQISWLVIDKNVINPQSPKALFFKETEEIILSIPTIKKSESFGKIDVYSVDLRDSPKSFVFFDSLLPIANPYQWTDYDQAYLMNGNYIANVKCQMPASPQGGSNVKCSYFPFRSFFSGKSQEDLKFNASIENDKLIIESTLNSEFSTLNSFDVLSFFEYENIVPVALVAQNLGNTISINAVVKTPEILIDGKKAWGGEESLPLFSVSDQAAYPLTLTVNGVIEFIIPGKITGEETLGTTFFTLHQDNIITIKDLSNTLDGQTITKEQLSQLSVFEPKEVSFERGNKKIEVRIPRINDRYTSETIFPRAFQNVKNCDLFREGPLGGDATKEILELSSENATACTQSYLPNLFHNEGYLISIKSQNIKGRGLHFWILDEDTKYAPIDTYLPSDKKLTTKSFILPPHDPYGKAYSLHFENVSIGNDEVKNTFYSAYVTPIPYRFLTAIVAESPRDTRLSREALAKWDGTFEVEHPNESLYVVKSSNGTMEQLSNETLILSQSYDPGWHAYQINVKCPSQRLVSLWLKMSNVKCFLAQAFPFLFGEELKEHVMVNNWQNGWILNDQCQMSQPKAGQPMAENVKCQIVIVYIPQYLEYLGFALLLITILYVAKSVLTSDGDSPEPVEGHGSSEVEKRNISEKIDPDSIGVETSYNMW